MKANSKMKNYLGSVLTESMNNLTIDLAKVENLIFPNFFEWDDCILLNQKKIMDFQLIFYLISLYLIEQRLKLIITMFT